MRSPRGLVYQFLILLTIIVVSHSEASADTIVPGTLAGVEGNSNNGFPFSIGAGHSMRYQQIQSAFEFPEVVLITGMAFRPDGPLGTPFLSVLPNVQIDLSTTNATIGGLSSVFANNIGSNVTTVFNGALALSSANAGPAGGPKDFDVVINFTVPFLYNPAAGNLLFDVRNIGGGIARTFDSNIDAFDTVARVFTACDPNPGGICSGVGNLTGIVSTEGLVTQFRTASVPEPGSAFYIFTSVTVLAYFRYRRSIAM